MSTFVANYPVFSTIRLSFDRQARAVSSSDALHAAVPMHEIISALSFALDLTEGATAGHGVRSCLYGMRIAQAIGLKGQQLSDLYYALLLKDIGCSSNSAKMCMLIGGDDRQMKHDVKLFDWTKPSIGVMGAIWKQTLPQASTFERASRLIKLAIDQNRNNSEMFQLRCDRGASIVRKIGMTDETGEAIRLLDEHWDGNGYPERLRGDSAPLLARIAGIAQHIDVFASEKGLPKAIEELETRSGRWFDPELVQLTRSLYDSGELGAAVGPFDHHARVMELRPDSGEMLAAGDIDRICEAFADVVDAKSSFTYAHSVGVTHAAVGIAEELGFGPERKRLIHRASLLHDLGKLSVPNTILDKPGKLDNGEWAIVKGHASLTEQILGRISHFGAIAQVAGQHHEKIDGSGYPYGLSGDQLSLDSRIIAVADVYGALSEDRPYRENLRTEQVIDILKKDVPNKLDHDCFEALLRYLEATAH